MGKKFRERVEQEKNADWVTKMRRSILFKIFLFSFKSLYVLAFVFYLMLGTAMTYSWVVTKWNRHYPPEYAGVLCKKYALGPEPDPDKIVYWLMARQPAEADIIMGKLEACTPFLSSITFLAFSNWKYMQGKKLEALNWRQYARFRARFDALRCGSNEAGENFNNIIEISGREDIQKMMERDPSLLPKSIAWALEYDAKFPPPQNNPREICKQLTAMEAGKYQMVPRAEWGGIHSTLRAISYYFIDLMEDKIKRGERPVLEMPSMKLPKEDMDLIIGTPQKDEEEKSPEKSEEKPEQDEKEE